MLLNGLAETRNVPDCQLCEGLCSASALSYIRTGERTPGILMSDTLLGRLGMSTGRFEHYLQYREYCEWKKRMGLVHDVDDLICCVRDGQTDDGWKERFDTVLSNKSGERFNFDKLESSLYIVMPYLYATTEYDKAWLLELSCRTISGKTNEKNLSLEVYY